VNISDKTFEQRMADVMKEKITVSGYMRSAINANHQRYDYDAHPTAEQAHMVVTQQMLDEIHFMLRELRERQNPPAQTEGEMQFVPGDDWVRPHMKWRRIKGEGEWQIFHIQD
jgi:hypothetical protein